MITEDAAEQVERGILKTGKEADVHLAEPQFRDDSRYRQARRTGNRTDLALDKGTRPGVAFLTSGEWPTSSTSWGRLWSASVAVPFPVQRIGRELLVDYADQAADMLAQALVNIRLCARRGGVLGDLSPYNVLVCAGRLFLIDSPQAVEPGHPPGRLHAARTRRDHVCRWARRHGLACTPARCPQRSWLKRSELGNLSPKDPAGSIV